jgi:hypothetical protein
MVNNFKALLDVLLGKITARSGCFFLELILKVELGFGRKAYTKFT